MKKKIIIATVIIAFLITVPTVLLKANSHNLSNRIPDVSVYIPDGFSDKYEDAKKDFLNEWHEIWMYDLKESEITAIDKDLSNGIWNPFSDEHIRYADEVYFGELKISYNESDEMLYSLYDCRAEGFTVIDITDTLLYAERQILFVYNKTQGDYYCVYIGM
ncbi:MAG: hypothetical protein IKK63_01540 [Clostridia bacterium]|nr:hypothetical protein [Clostridia bacterium]MBR3819802.1 hypothetical protein [Clostridia bacterium]